MVIAHSETPCSDAILQLPSLSKDWSWPEDIGNFAYFYFKAQCRGSTGSMMMGRLLPPSSAAPCSCHSYALITHSPGCCSASCCHNNQNHNPRDTGYGAVRRLQQLTFCFWGLLSPSITSRADHRTSLVPPAYLSKPDISIYLSKCFFNIMMVPTWWVCGPFTAAHFPLHLLWKMSF